jgi:hypothetical protein
MAGKLIPNAPVDYHERAARLLTLAEQLSANDPELGTFMLLVAAASVAPDRATYLKMAEHAFDAWLAQPSA